MSTTTTATRATPPSSEGPSFPEAQLDAWRALLDAHAGLMARMEQALAEEQLPPLGWYDVLSALHRAPDQSLRPRDLGLHLTISKSGLTRLVDRIAAAGLIERRDCLTDRRGHLIALTDAGNSMLYEMWPIYASALEENFTRHLTRSEAETLGSLLDRLRQEACDGASPDEDG